MIERRRRDGRYKQFAFAIKLIVSAARDWMLKIMPVEAGQCRARFIGSIRVAGLDLRDPSFRNFGLRPQTAAVPFDVAVRVAFIDQETGRIFAITQCRSKQLGPVSIGRATGNSLKGL
jgi:hypothetical protein